jgi:hypothetical protein
VLPGEDPEYLINQANQEPLLVHIIGIMRLYIVVFDLFSELRQISLKILINTMKFSKEEHKESLLTSWNQA